MWTYAFRALRPLAPTRNLGPSLLVACLATCLAAVTAPGVAEPVIADSVRVWNTREAGDEDTRLVPVEATGDIRFTLDAVPFRTVDDQVRTDLYLAVPHVSLAWIRSGQTYRAEVRVTGKVYAREGGTARSFDVVRVIHTNTFESTKRKGDRSPVSLEVITAFEPGLVEVRVEDERSMKSTLIGQLRGDKKDGRARGFTRLPRSVDAAGPALSGLVFGHSADTDEAAEPAPGTVTHGPVRLLPNPSRYFGKRQAVFPVYFEEYAGSEDSRDQSLVRYRVRDARGATILSADSEYAAPAPRAGRIQRFDVSDFPTGSYELVVELLDDEGGSLAATAQQFHVFWTDLVWEQDEKETLDDARVLLSADEFDVFRTYSAGERAAYMRRLWETVDLTPGEPGNPARERFRARVRYAETNYRGLEGGKLSDRGRIYIRFGPPDAIETVRVPTETDEMFTVLSEELEGKLGYVIDSKDPRFESFLRRQANRNSAFEIWIYNEGGDPILAGREGPRRGMGFVLVDETGVGIFKLRYSSVLGIM